LRAVLYIKDFNEKINEPVDVILSPQYYWIKKIDIPVKTLKDAKKLSKTLFKLDESHIYDAFELNGGFFAYAVKKDLKLNIDKKYINSIRLAQSELYEYDKINVSKNYSIQKIEDLLFCFPYTQDAPDAKDILKNLKLSKHTLNLYNSLNIDKSVLVYSAVILLFMNFIFIAGLIRNKSAVNELEKQKETLVKKNTLPKTTFQLKSILENLKSENAKQIKIRKNLEFITKTPLQKGEKFTQLAYDKNFHIEIKTKRNLDRYFSKRFKVTSSLKNSIYKAELYDE
jgi:hypothetical protein